MAKRRKGEEPEVDEQATAQGEEPEVDEQATAQGEEPEVDAAAQLAEEAAMLGKMTPIERARFAFGLEEEHVLKARETTAPDGSVEVVMVTQGGQKLRWPQDEGRVLAQHEKDGTVPGAPAAGIFPVRQ